MTEGPYTVRDVVVLTSRFLITKGISSARLDAELLVAHALGLRRLDIFLDPDRPIAPNELDRIRELVRRRGRGEPIAYIRGFREFYGLSLSVGQGVFIPRPETEVIVDAALAFLVKIKGSSVVADVGTGAGAIACAIAKHAPDAIVHATDISSRALSFAAKNVSELRLEQRVKLHLCDLLDSVSGPLDMVVSNPPYIAETDAVDRSVLDFEPHAALFGGPDGMSVIKRLVPAAIGRLKPGGNLILEVGTPDHASMVDSLLRSSPALSNIQPIPDAQRVVRGYSAIKTEDQCIAVV